MAESFDPYSQVFTIVGPDGRTKIPVSMQTLNFYYNTNVCLAISYSGQVCVAGFMLLVIVLMTERAKLTRPSTVLNMVGLTSCLINRLLLALYYTGPFANVYSALAGDYAAVPRSKYVQSIAATTVGTVLIAVVELALMYQAWTLLRTWSKMSKWILGVLSVMLVLLVLGFRFASMVYQNISILDLYLPNNTIWILQTSVILSGISIFWFCALFNLRLISHLVKNRGVLPSRDSLNPMEVLVIANGILMVIPVIFAGTQWSSAGDSFESTSWAYTSVVVILPLGSLIAQRVTRNTTAASVRSPDSLQQGWTPKLLSTTKTGTTAPMSSVTSGAEAASTRNLNAKDAFDRELLAIDDGDDDDHTVPGSRCRVRVHHEIDQTEKRV